jgi:thymidylate synthase ThyX
MSTQSAQAYNPRLGLTVPPAIEKAGLAQTLLAFGAKAESLYDEIGGRSTEVASYALTNAHRRRVFFSANLRELYHVVRLRDDGHAQWDIRNLAHKMRVLAEKTMPLGSLLLCGKDSYAERYEEIFGRRPSVVPPA